MARGKSKVATNKTIAPTPSMSQAQRLDLVGPAMPALANQSFASVDPPSRIRVDGFSCEPGIRYRFPHIYEGLMPFQSDGNFISVRDAIWLCQKAYFNISIFRNSINTLAELCNTDVCLKDGNQQSKDFFEAWFKRINLWKLKDMFFRELFRSGNVFFFRVDGSISKSDALKLNQTYGAATDIELPLRYILLNVADIAAMNSLNYDAPAYYKVLTPQQIRLLKASPSADDREIYKSLPAAIKNYFDGAALGQPIPIDLTKLHTIFYQRQDYEPFAVPMGFAVLDDLNLKMELKKTDAILARTVEYMTLLVTTGSEVKDNGTGGVSKAAIGALREMFSKEQIGRVLVADYTTQMKWVIPELEKILGPAKYQMVNQDISTGLMDFFFAEEKFSSLTAKLKVFVAKMNRVQEIFINDFLQPEIRRIAQLMNFKSYPTAELVDLSLDDPTQMMRIYTQLIQLGVLTAKDGTEAMETGEIPDFETILQNQKDYKGFKDDGLFQPVIMAYPPDQVAAAQAKFPKPVAGGGPPSGGGKPSQPAGRPPGAKAPQTTKRVGPIGTGAEQKFSMSKLIDTVKLMDEVKNDFTLAYKKKHKLKRLNDSHKDIIETMSKTLFENEASTDWSGKVNDYVDSPIPPNVDKALEIEDIASEYDLSSQAAILLYHSKI